MRYSRTACGVYRREEEVIPGFDKCAVHIIQLITHYRLFDGCRQWLALELSLHRLLFIDFQTPNRIRVQATATISGDDELLQRYPGANLIVRAHVDKVFLNCARYIHKHTRVETSPYVPASDGAQPFPAWKRIDALQDSLLPQDKGKAELEGGVISQDEYGAKLMAGES